MGLDLLLVNAPSRAGVYQKLSEFAAIEPPVWAGLLAQALRKKGFSVGILDAEAAGLNPLEAAGTISMLRPKLAAFCIYGHQPSASTQSMPAASETAELLRSMSTGIPTLALGTHPSALPERTLFDGFDFACQGEGLRTLEAYFSGGPVPGLWVVNVLAGNIHHSPPAPLIQNLDAELPGQAWDLLNMTRYRPHHWHAWTGRTEGGYASVQTSLGCPFKCSFCCINTPFGGAGIRYWSPTNVAAQIWSLVEQYGITNIKIPDEMFFLNRQHVLELCKLLVDMGLGQKLNMWAYARIDTVKDERLLAQAREAGFRWLGIGIESGSKHVRDGVEKGRFGNEDILRACERVEAAGLHIGANYIFGLPDDTEESMKETLSLACEVNAAYANFYCAMAYPGSPLHKLALEKKWRLPESIEGGRMGPNGWEKGFVGPGWIGYSQHSYESLPLRTEALSSEQVLDFRDDAFMLYHTRFDYLAKLGRCFGPKAVDITNQITALGKPRRKHRDPNPPDPFLKNVTAEDLF